MHYQIIGDSIFGTTRTTPEGRAYDDEFRSNSPADYAFPPEQHKGVDLLILMEHYGAKPACRINTDFGMIDIYQTPVLNGIIVCKCTYTDGLYSHSPAFRNTVSPLAIVNHFHNIRQVQP